MSDYIDRQAAIDAIGSYILSFTAIDRNYYEGLRDAKRLLNDIPSAEVEPVTRCKGCIYYRQEIDMCDEPYSTAHNVVREDDYCSRAERKEKE